MAMDQPVDLLVVGGGVNGTGIARDSVGRGLSVLLCEQDDLASHTSSASSKLIHGGLRYLEHYEFRLVREALIEREVLLRVSMANEGPLPQADLLAMYRRLFAATRALEARDRQRGDLDGGPGDDGR